jgi:hypothetical protein
MATDPERVQQLEEEAARRERIWRKPAEQGFGDVLKSTPARASAEDAPAPEAESDGGAGVDGRPPQDAQGPATAQASPAKPQDAADSARQPTAAPALDRSTKTAGLPPDPRARALHKLLDNGGAERTSRPSARPLAASGETPPTGSIKAGSIKTSVLTR